MCWISARDEKSHRQQIHQAMWKLSEFFNKNCENSAFNKKRVFLKCRWRSGIKQSTKNMVVLFRYIQFWCIIRSMNRIFQWFVLYQVPMTLDASNGATSFVLVPTNPTNNRSNKSQAVLRYTVFEWCHVSIRFDIPIVCGGSRNFAPKTKILRGPLTWWILSLFEKSQQIWHLQRLRKVWVFHRIAQVDVIWST